MSGNGAHRSNRPPLRKDIVSIQYRSHPRDAVPCTDHESVRVRSTGSRDRALELPNLMLALPWDSRGRWTRAGSYAGHLFVGRLGRRPFSRHLARRAGIGNGWLWRPRGRPGYLAPGFLHSLGGQAQHRSSCRRPRCGRKSFLGKRELRRMSQGWIQGRRCWSGS